MYKLIWPKVDNDKVYKEISEFFNISDITLTGLHEEYNKIVKAFNHMELGELKTLNSLETFILFVMIKKYNPSVLSEIGTLLGKSTRRLLDIKKSLNLKLPITCYDIVDNVKHFKKHEVDFVIKDVTKSVKNDIIDKSEDGLIYLDAHPYEITYNTIMEVLNSKYWTLAIHDCGEALCNPNMKITKNDPNITSLTGHWERYVLAEIFGVKNPLDDKLNNQETPSHKMKIFSTMHGLCVVVPK